VTSIAPFRISVCGIEELAGHCDAGVSHVLSILDPEWPVPEAFGAFGEHARLELRFHDVIEASDPDMIAPRQEHASSKRCCRSARRLGRICESSNSATRCWAGAASSLRRRPGSTGPSSIGGSIWPSRCGPPDAAGRSRQRRADTQPLAAAGLTRLGRVCAIRIRGPSVAQVNRAVPGDGQHEADE
jgi:hypothetical protein